MSNSFHLPSEHFDSDNHANAVVEERRENQRVEHMAPATLMSYDVSEPIGCTIRDISESGLFLHAPASSGIGVGSRFEVVLDETDESCAGLLDAFSCGCYATVVRTSSLEGTASHAIGAGLRFDQPLIL